MNQPPTGVDARAARFGQGATGLVALAAFVLDVTAPVPFLALVLAAGAFLGPRWNLWSRVFAAVVRPRLGPPAAWKAAAPVRFANLVGALFLAAATLLFAAGVPVAAWALVFVVAALALLAAATGFCVGCEMYVLGLRVLARARATG